MQYFNTGLGLFLILMGFLIVKYPNLIAGYNTLPEEQKKNIDIAGLSRWMRNCFVFMGGAILIAPPLLKAFGLKVLANNSIIIVVLATIPVLLIRAQQFNRNVSSRSKSILKVVVVLLIISVLPVGMIMYGLQSPEITIINKTITISGMYGMTAPVDSVKLVPALPSINRRTNGFYFYNTSKGTFSTNDNESVMLYLESGNDPFIKVITPSHAVYINRLTSSQTKALYEELKRSIP